MLAALGVGVLVAGLAVKAVEAELILGEVGRHPVHDDANAGLMELVHKGHQVFGGAVAAGGGKIARDLVAPAAIERILHDGQQLHMGVAHLGDVRDELICQLRVVVRDIALFGLPAARVHLVDVHGAVDHVGFLLGGLPALVMPGIAVQVVDLAAVGRAGLGVERVGVGLINQIPRAGGDAVFVHVVFFHARDKQLPDRIAVYFAHRVASRFPAVKIAHHADGHGMRCPDAEYHARLPGPLLNVRAKVAVRFTVIALLEQIHRQVRWTAVDLFLSRFHKRSSPYRLPDGSLIPFTLLY